MNHCRTTITSLLAAWILLAAIVVRLLGPLPALGEDLLFTEPVISTNAQGASFLDCNNNGTPDDVDIARGTSQDCNKNEVPNECDIYALRSLDTNGNDVPDECEGLYYVVTYDGAVLPQDNPVAPFSVSNATNWSINPPGILNFIDPSQALNSNFLRNDAVDPVITRDTDWALVVGVQGISGNSNGANVDGIAIETSCWFDDTDTPDPDDKILAAIGLDIPQGGFGLVNVPSTAYVDFATFAGVTEFHTYLMEYDADNESVSVRLLDVVDGPTIESPLSSLARFAYVGERSSVGVSSGTPATSEFNVDFLGYSIGPIDDCNGNGVSDTLDILAGISCDLDGNGTPDECEFGQSIAFVDADAVGQNDGSSWADAFNDLQDALCLAGAPSSSVSEIRVAQGTYKPAGPGGDPAATFQLRDGVSLAGGFAGFGEPDPNLRDPAAFETVLDGDLNGDDGYFQNNSENSYHIVTANIAGVAAIDGFTITQGNARPPLLVVAGAGVLIASGTVNVNSCNFVENRIEYDGTQTTASGAGIFVFAGAAARVRECVFRENRADGGAFAPGIGAVLSDLQVFNSSFIDNIASATGGPEWYSAAGAIYLETEATLIANCLFHNNAARRGGAIYDGQGQTAISGCTIVDNSATEMGGGYWHGTPGVNDPHPQIDNCVIWGNTSPNGSTECNQVRNDLGWPTVHYSCIQGLGVFGGNGNIADPPVFEDQAGGDLRLAIASPCIDAADSTSVPLDLLDLDDDGDVAERLPIDLDGLGRFSDDPNTPDTGLADPPNYPEVVDMGAYERIGFLDCNGNGMPDDEDIANDPSLDCNANGIPDECDIAEKTSQDCNDDGIPDECTVELEKLLAFDGAAGDQFGNAVSISGDVAVIGAPLDDDAEANFGSAYVYRYDGDAWMYEAKLAASDAGLNDQFGSGVSVSGDWAVIGSPLDDDAGSSSGSAYMFRYNGITWEQEDKVVASDGEPFDYFGRSAAISGDWAVIGAWGSDDGGSEAGSAYVFRYDGRDWLQEARLTAFEPAADDHFGRFVAISGDLIVIGVSQDDDAGDDSGSAYVYRYDGDSWVEEARLIALDAEAGDRFGQFVSVSGNLAAIGAIGSDDAGVGSGSAYVYRHDGDTWVEEAKLTASDAMAEDHFGFCVSVSGDLTLIGAPGNQSVVDVPGSAYVYRYNGSTWVEKAKLTASDAAVDDMFGWALSLDGDVALIGAQLDDDAGDKSGSAYIFDAMVDCNDNGIPDECDIDEGTSLDCDANGIPDECQVVDGCELSAWTGLGDGINWNDPNNWCPIVVPNNNGTDYAVIVGPGANINLDTNVIICGLDLDSSSTINADDNVGHTLNIESPDGLVTEGTINIQNNNNKVEAGGVIANDGFFNIIATNGIAELVPAAAGTMLSGVGEVRMFNPNTSRLGSTDAARSLTNGGDHLVCGTGEVVGNFINDGIVTADDPGGNAITLSGPSNTVRTNNNLLQTQGGGAIRIGGVFDQSGSGVLSSASSGSIVRIGDSGLPEAAVAGGTIQQGDGKVFLANRARIEDLTIEGGLTVPSLLDYAFVEGQIVNNGRVILNPLKASNATLATFTIDGPMAGAVQFDGNGTIEMGNDTRAVLDSLGPFFPAMTNGTDHTIEGIGIIRANLVNDGRIVAKLVGPGSTLSIRSGAGTNQNVNNGIFEATGFATLSIETDVQNDGAIVASTNGVARILDTISGTGELQADGGTIDIAPGGGSVSVTGSGASVTNAGRLYVDGDAEVNVQGILAINSCGAYAASPNAPGTVTASLSVEEVCIGESVLGEGGALMLTDSMSADVSGGVTITGFDAGALLGGCTTPRLRAADAASINTDHVIIAGSGSLELANNASMETQGDVLLLLHESCNALNVGGCTTPRLSVVDLSRLAIGGDLSIPLMADITIAAPFDPMNPHVTLSGDLINNSTDPSTFTWDAGPLTLNGTGGPQMFEAAGNDLGALPAGLVSNFAMGTLEVLPATEVAFVDVLDNLGGQTTCTEAVYVHDLILRSGALVSIEDTTVYYESIIDEGGTVTLIGCGQLTLICGGDMTGDCQVTLEDFDIFQDCFTGVDNGPFAEGCEQADFDHDGDIDCVDFGQFQLAFDGKES